MSFEAYLRRCAWAREVYQALNLPQRDWARRRWEELRREGKKTTTRTGCPSLANRKED